MGRFCRQWLLKIRICCHDSEYLSDSGPKANIKYWKLISLYLKSSEPSQRRIFQDLFIVVAMVTLQWHCYCSIDNSFIFGPPFPPFSHLLYAISFRYLALESHHLELMLDFLLQMIYRIEWWFTRRHGNGFSPEPNLLQVEGIFDDSCRGNSNTKDVLFGWKVPRFTNTV